jgi:hypothetical protein
MRAIIWAAIAALVFAAPCFAADPYADPAPNPALTASADTPMFATGRIYPYVGVEQRWTFSPVEYDYQDFIWHVGAAYSLGTVSPSLTWRWNPEDGADINELVLGVRVNLRGLFR